jgi:plastocyanin
VDTRVKWIYADNDCDASSLCPGHNVKRPHHPVSSTVKSDGAVIYSMVFHHTGTYSYFCAVHHDSGMTGKVVVVP